MPKTSLAITAEEIARHVGGDIKGDANSSASAICSSEELIPNGLSFITRVPKDVSHFLETLRASKTSILLVDLPTSARFSQENLSQLTLVVVKSPIHAAVSLIPLFYEQRAFQPGISPQAVVDPSAKLGEGVSVQAFCSVGADVVIADNVTLYPSVIVYPGAVIGQGSVIHSGVTIREECEIGEFSVIQNGAVIGSDGFGYIPGPENNLIPFPQIGSVKLGNKVDIGANTCIDRAALGTTSIDEGSKLDNLVQVGHNTRIGKHSVLCGQVGISGSCEIGNGVTIAGAAGVADHVKIVDGCRVGALSGVTKSIKEKGDYAGFPARKARDWWQRVALLEKLPKVLAELQKSAGISHK